jgi:uncharacterized protein YuzE
MEKKLTVIHNKEMETLDIWFDDPKKEVVCEEVGEGIILKKDKKNKVIGLEVLYYSKKDVLLEFKVLSAEAAICA